MSKVIYLTGAPASGKSTLTENISKRFPDACIFTYSKELLKVVERRVASVKTQDDLRQHSAAVITHDDVKIVDNELLKLLETTRNKKNVIIDSHPVTIESYGFRVTPFAKAQIKRLNPDVIICLFSDAETVRKRICENPAGRPLPSSFELDLHTQLQSQIASIYAMETGARLFLLNSSVSRDELLDNFIKVTAI